MSSTLPNSHKHAGKLTFYASASWEQFCIEFIFDDVNDMTLDWRFGKILILHGVCNPGVYDMYISFPLTNTSS